MLKVFLAAQKLSDAIVVDGEWLAPNSQFVYEGPIVSSFYISRTVAHNEIKIEFTAESLKNARFNDVTAAFELFDKTGQFTTLNFQRMTPLLEHNMRLRALVTKQQYSGLSEEDHNELASFIDEELDSFI